MLSVGAIFCVISIITEQTIFGIIEIVACRIFCLGNMSELFGQLKIQHMKFFSCISQIISDIPLIQSFDEGIIFFFTDLLIVEVIAFVC
jgi:hypothetical protein